MSDFSNKPVKMTKYQLLGVPSTFEDMVHKISLNGILSLKQGRFKTRHNKSKEIIQIPTSGYTLTSLRKKTHPQDFPKKPIIKKVTDCTKDQKETRRRSHSYKVNKSEITNRIKQYVLQMPGKKQLYFWTITFPDKTSDDAAFILFNKWLTRLRQESLIKSYLWVTERQENGTIHFHMAIHSYMDVFKANRYMRSSIMYSIDSKEINWTRQQAKNYNGVHITKDKKTGRVVNFAKQKKEKSLTNYLTKYVTKNNGIFPHLAWHSSRDYSNLIINLRLSESEFIQYHLSSFIELDNPLSTEYFFFYRWKGQPPNFISKYFSQLNFFIQNHLLCNMN